MVPGKEAGKEVRTPLDVSIGLAALARLHCLGFSFAAI